MMCRLYIVLLAMCIFTGSSAKGKMNRVTVNLIETSDVHGNIFPYNFITRSNGDGSLARVSSFVRQQRKRYGDNVILMDNGDILQGQPTVYYYNFIDTISPHISSQIMNYMKYDVATLGNHDVETGHDVYDRWVSECNFPVLGANIINTKSGLPYLKPYEVFMKDGVKIVVLGMITPAIPCWLPENLWHGMQFDDLEQSARKWVEIIKRDEKPDVLVGLFHSGQSGSKLNNIVENGSLDVAKNVPGFDIVFMGHDHALECKKILNVAGDSVLVVDPANRANNVASVKLDIELDRGKVVSKRISGELVKMNSFFTDKELMDKFSSQYDIINHFVSEKIGTISSTISAKEAFFGPCGFMNLIHDLQLKITGADVSFAAPLSFSAKINQGDIYM